MIHPLLAFLRHTPQPYHMTLTERLPAHITAPCEISCSWQLTEESLTWTLAATLHIVCQRCAQSDEVPFAHQHTLVLCKDVTTLKQQKADQDCLLIEELPLRLEDLITDELYLSAPDKHVHDCLSGKASP